MDPEYGIPSIAAQDGKLSLFRGALLSLLLHAGMIAITIIFFRNLYRSEEFKRPPTFTLVDVPTPKPISEPVKHAAIRRQSTVAPAQEQTPKVQEVEADLIDKNPVPSAEPAAETIGGSGTSPGRAGDAGDADQPVAVASATLLDNTNFSPIFNPKPAYPAIANKANIEGYVDVELIVSAAGTIESFTILKTSGHPAFGEETAKVIKRWRFPPPRINGKPSKIKYDYRVNFTLN
jgi:periplasmic protein TonB